MQNSIKTERLLLNLLSTDDHEFIHSLLNTKGWIEFIGERNIQTSEDAIRYIRKILATQNLWYWVVKTRESLVPIGIISFMKRDYLENFDIGFAFLPGFMGMGLAFEAASEILSYVKKEQGYNPVIATTLPHNLRSIKLLTRLGMHFEREIMVENEKLLVYTSALS
jgi:RimJ/RimL family protein N-acetyltransferase